MTRARDVPTASALTLFDYPDSFPDSDASSPDLGSSSPDSSDKTSKDPAIDPEEWSKLQDIARPVAEMGRVSRKRMVDTILQLCLDGFRTKKELAELVQRKPDYLQEGYLTPLVKSGKLQPRHPERMTHQNQAYLTTRDENQQDYE